MWEMTIKELREIWSNPNALIEMKKEWGCKGERLK